jgi:hypothetical protein
LGAAVAELLAPIPGIPPIDPELVVDEQAASVTAVATAAVMARV